NEKGLVAAPSETDSAPLWCTLGNTKELEQPTVHLKSEGKERGEERKKERKKERKRMRKGERKRERKKKRERE
ncbi:RNA-binding protein 25-like, partial [Heteronotia binoei]|uniref:RNA-binding protein 25-like n=1 Tax=Heteronotia binoei TaxID=13085 RepID=UPI00292FFF87